MNRVIVAIVTLVALGQLGCVSSHGPIAPTMIVDSDLERLAVIQKKAPKGNEEQVFPSNLVFSGPVKSGIYLEYSDEETEKSLSGNANFVTINRRVAKLQDGGSLGYGKNKGSESSKDESSKEKVQSKLREYITFGLQVIKVPRPGGKSLYYAVSPSRSTQVFSVTGSPVVSKPDLKKFSRSDFVNPEDIDWMLEVGDFTEIKPVL